MDTEVKFTSLNAVTATGAGIAHGVGNRTKLSYQVKTTGSPTSWSVDLEGTIDGTNWVVMDTLASTDATMIKTPINAGLFLVRLNLTALVGGTNPTVTGTVLAKA